MYTLKNENGATKTVKNGVSWTVFFFGFIVPLTRGDWKWAIIMLVVDMLTFGLASCVLAFFYNKIYLDGLLNSGYSIL